MENQMALLDWLRGRTPAETSPPPVINLTAAARAHNADHIVLAEIDAPEPEQAIAGRRYILEPYFWMIEYTDSDGVFSRRRITMRNVIDDGRTQILHALCHERHALRSFRVDRISSLISQDGEVEAATPWFADILAISDWEPIEIKAKSTQRTAAYQPAISPYTALRREITPALTVLIAAARSDDYLHPKEVTRILRFAEDEAANLHRAGLLPGNPEAEAYAKLERTITRLRPTRQDVETAFDDLARIDLQRKRHLARAIADTAAADGRVDDIEAALIEELSAHGARQHGFGWEE